jgi:DNA-binding NarL/FixJ family response regulator
MSRGARHGFCNDRPPRPLSPRELQILNALATGRSNKQIAQQLCVTSHTVKFHLGRLFDKFGVRTRIQALIVAARMGFVDDLGSGSSSTEGGQSASLRDIGRPA